MIIGVIGSKGWEDYQLLIRKVTIEIEEWRLAYPDDTKLLFFHAGQQGAENMITEYVGKVEKFMRQKGLSVSDRVSKVRGQNIMDADFNLINSPIDKLIIFAKEPCVRSRKAATIAEAVGKPYTYIKD